MGEIEDLAKVQSRYWDFWASLLGLIRLDIDSGIFFFLSSQLLPLQQLYVNFLCIEDSGHVIWLKYSF